MTPAPRLADFPVQDFDKIRYADTDRLGHVNNAMFATYLETGRAGLLKHPGIPPGREAYFYVLARLEMDFRAELHWPGLVNIGTAVKSIGTTSLVLAQALFQEETCAATAQVVMVQISKTSKRPEAFTPDMRALLEALRVKGSAG